jgi:hypothetical protein
MGADSRRGQMIERELPGYFNYWGPCDRFDNDNRLQNGNRYLLSNGWKGNIFNRLSNGLFHNL